MKLIKANTVIKINGKTYSNSDEMPKPFQSLLKDENQNGLPDIFEGEVAKGNIKVNVKPNIVIKGQHYSSWDEVPPEYQKYREKAEGIQKKLQDGNLTDLFSQSGLKGLSSDSASFNPIKSKIQNPTESRGRILLLIIAIILAILGYVYFF